MYNAVMETLNELRSRYWVAKGRQAVCELISRCTTCKKLEGRPYNTPSQLPLPEFRVSDEFAFNRTGVDFAGPLFMRRLFKG